MSIFKKKPSLSDLLHIIITKPELVPVSEMKLHISALRLAMSNISQSNTEVENFMRLFF
jgi:hypothetical protein